jgi:hypothetical protein
MKTIFNGINTLVLAGVLSACGGGGGTTNYGNLEQGAQNSNFTALLAAVKKSALPAH